MRDLHTLDKFRVPDSLLPEDWQSHDKSTGGFFAFALPNEKEQLRVIVSIGEGWEHVSVSTNTRCPTWEEMEQMKRIFWYDWEPAFQLHPPVGDYVNCHPYCL